jgi:hypothetical protein
VGSVVVKIGGMTYTYLNCYLFQMFNPPLTLDKEFVNCIYLRLTYNCKIENATRKCSVARKVRFDFIFCIIKFTPANTIRH